MAGARGVPVGGVFRSRVLLGGEEGYIFFSPTLCYICRQYATCIIRTRLLIFFFFFFFLFSQNERGVCAEKSWEHLSTAMYGSALCPRCLLHLLRRALAHLDDD